MTMGNYRVLVVNEYEGLYEFFDSQELARQYVVDEIEMNEADPDRFDVYRITPVHMSIAIDKKATIFFEDLDTNASTD